MAVAEAKGNEKRSQEKEKEKTRTKKIVQGQGITSRQRASRLRAWRLAVVISWHYLRVKGNEKRSKEKEKNKKSTKTKNSRAGHNLKAKSFTAAGLQAGCAYFVALGEVLGKDKRCE